MALDPKKRQKKLAKQKQKDKARRKTAAKRRESEGGGSVAPAAEGFLSRLVSGGTPPTRLGFPEEEQTYRVRVELDGSEPLIWRELLLSNRLSLADLHDVLHFVMEWDGEHLHYFHTAHGQYSAEPSVGWEADAKQVGLGRILEKPGDELVYEYDMGDSWRHVVVLEEIGLADPERPRAICLAGERSGPPEDSGGIWRYNEALEVLTDPEREEFEELQEWYGEDFDPARFDLEQVNRKLARHFPPSSSELEVNATEEGASVIPFSARDGADDEDEAEHGAADEEAVDELEEDLEPSPELRRELMGVIQTQIRNGDPPVARETFERLRKEGFSPEEAHRMMSQVLFLETLAILARKENHDPKRYAAAMRLLPKFSGDV